MPYVSVELYTHTHTSTLEKSVNELALKKVVNTFAQCYLALPPLPGGLSFSWSGHTAMHWFDMNINSKKSLPKANETNNDDKKHTQRVRERLTHQLNWYGQEEIWHINVFTIWPVIFRYGQQIYHFIYALIVLKARKRGFSRFSKCEDYNFCWFFFVRSVLRTHIFRLCSTAINSGCFKFN